MHDFRNRSAESLYGWKEYEVLGQEVAEVLVSEEYYEPFQKIMDSLSSSTNAGRRQSWSGQFPYKKRSGEIFMAIMTKSPLYENGELAGFITVSSDAALFNSIGSDQNLRTCDEDRHQPRSVLRGLNLKGIKWHPRPPISPGPQIASSVSNQVLILIIICSTIQYMFMKNSTTLTHTVSTVYLKC